MSQPLKYSSQNDLAKVSGRESKISSLFYIAFAFVAIFDKCLLSRIWFYPVISRGTAKNIQKEQKENDVIFHVIPGPPPGKRALGFLSSACSQGWGCSITNAPGTIARTG